MLRWGVVAPGGAWSSRQRRQMVAFGPLGAIGHPKMVGALRIYLTCPVWSNHQQPPVTPTCTEFTSGAEVPARARDQRAESSVGLGDTSTRHRLEESECHRRSRRCVASVCLRSPARGWTCKRKIHTHMIYGSEDGLMMSELLSGGPLLTQGRW